MEEQLRKWGENTSEYFQQTAHEVKEIMLIVAQTAQAVGERDQRYARQFGEPTILVHQLKGGCHSEHVDPDFRATPDWFHLPPGYQVRSVRDGEEEARVEAHRKAWRPIEMPGPGEIVVPLRLRHGDGELRFMSIVSTFGTPLDVTLQELSIEAFLPVDAATREALT